jgi:signal transduction histidine kinase
MRSLKDRVIRRGVDALVITLAILDVARIWIAPVVPRGGATALALLATLPLLARKRFPLGAPLTSLAGYAGLTLLVPGAPAEELQLFLGSLLTFWVIGSENERRHAVFGLAIGLGVTVLVVATDHAHHRVSDFIFALVIMPAAWAGGVTLGARARAAAAAERRAERLAIEKEVATRDAVQQERVRLARELHDVIAHTVSVMVVQAGAAEQVLDGENLEARAALDAIRQSGKSALVELRRLLGLLRDVEPGELAPQPSLAAIDNLLTETQAAGVSVSIERHGEPRALPTGLDQTAYRIVQEALTNAIKHAAPATAVVSIGWEADAVELRISDDGRGANGSAGGGGHGLIGMRERAHLYGGELEAGPRPGGGFEVVARLPL